MRLFMTGASGRLGSRLVRRLLEAPGIEIFAVRRATSSLDLLKGGADRVRWHDGAEVSFSDMLAETGPDIVLHCATQYRGDQSEFGPLVESNVAVPVRLLDAAVGCKAKAFINIDTMLPEAVSPYSLSKGQFREWLRFRASAILAVNVASELFFGTGCGPDNFVTDLVRRLSRGDARIPLTTGEQVRDFIPIDDLVEAIERVLIHVMRARSDSGYECFEVGGGSPRSVREFVLMVQEILGNRLSVLDFGLIPYRENEPMLVVPDLARIRAIGWVPRHAISETIIGMANEGGVRSC